MACSLFKKNYALLFLPLLILLSCWDDKESILEPTNNAPSWTSLIYNDSCEIGDTLSIDLLGKAADAEKDSLIFNVVHSNIDSNAFSIDSGYLNVIAYQHPSNLCSLKISVSDGLLFDTTNFIISFFEDINAKYWKDSIFINKKSELTTCTLNLSTFLIDSLIKNDISFSILNDTNSIDTIIDSILQITFIDSLTSPYTICLIASDGNYKSDTAIFQFNINHSPFWTIDNYNDTCLSGDTLNINLLLLALDNDFDSLNFEITDSLAKNICTINNGYLSLLAPSDTSFDLSVNIIVSDSTLFDTATFTFKIKEEIINQPPSWKESSFIDSCASGDTLVINLKLLASDPEDNVLTFTIINKNILGHLNIDSNNLTYISPEDTTFEASFIVEVSDGKLADTANFTLSIKETIQNKSPFWIEATFIDSCHSNDSIVINLETFANDPDGDQLIFSIIENNSTGAKIEELKILKFIPPFDSTFSTNFIVEVSDGELSDSAIFTFNISKPNVKPEFVTNKPKVLYEIEEGQDITIDLEATDSDAEDIVTYGISDLGGLPNSSIDNLNSNQFNWTSTSGNSGAYVIIFFATDGKDSTYISTTIKIGEANIPPTITVSDTFANGIAVLEENDNLTINFTFSDLDVEDILVISQSLPNEIGLHFNLASDNKSGILTFATNFNTVINNSQKILDTIKITVSDGEDATTYNLVITVNNVNRAPSFNVDSPKDLYAVVAGSSLTIPFSATDPDSQETGTATVDESTFKSGADIQKNIGNIVWNTTIGDIGNHLITFNATDGDTTISKEVAISVSENNDAPTITIGNYSDGQTITITEEESIEFTVVATPVLDGDIVTLSKVGEFNPAATYNPSNGNFNFTANYDMTSQNNADSIFTFVFTAKGSASNAAVAQFTINIKVTNVNRAPRFTVVPRDTTIGIGNEYSSLLTIVDDDSDHLNISFTDSKVSYKNGNAYWHISNITEELGNFLSIGAVVSDGDTTIYSNKWRIDLIEHQWREVLSFDSIVDVVATDSNNIHILLPGNQAACYTSKGSLNWESSYSPMSSIMTPFGAKLYKNKIICRAKGGGAERFNTYLLSNSSVDSLGKYTTNARSSTYATYVIDTDSLFIRGTWEIEAARKGVNIFGINTDEGGDLIIDRMLNGSYVWDTVATFRSFRDLEIASDNGNVIYFISDENEIYVSKNARTMTTFVNQAITNAPTDIKNIYSLNDSTAWAVTNSGSVHFTSHYFENNNHYKEKIGAIGEQIQKVVISYNRDAIYAISNKKVYKY